MTQKQAEEINKELQSCVIEYQLASKNEDFVVMHRMIGRMTGIMKVMSILATPDTFI